MAEPTGSERGHDGGDLASAARDRGMEQLESAKAQLAEGAERVAAAVERTADELEGGDEEGISGFGRSAATLMRQLAGGLRERDVEEFARELGSLARRNPGVFLAGSVALGFGIARFFKARPPRARPDGGYASRGDDWPSSFDSELREREDFDPDESLDLSASSLDGRDAEESVDLSASSVDRHDTEERLEGAAVSPSPDGGDRRGEQRVRGKGRQAGKKGKPQRASASDSEPTPSTEGSAAVSSTDGASTGEAAGAASRGDQS